VQDRGFLYVHTPIITASDCEGAGEMFQVCCRAGVGGSHHAVGCLLYCAEPAFLLCLVGPPKSYSSELFLHDRPLLLPQVHAAVQGA